MKWFKHYNDASLSNTLTQIIANTGIIGYGRYWLLLEKMCSKFNGEDDEKFVFSRAELRGHLGFHRDQDLIKYLSSLNQVGIMSHFSINQVVEIESDILLRLQGRDYKKARSVRAETAPKNKIKNKIKNKNIYIRDEKIVELVEDYNFNFNKQITYDSNAKYYKLALKHMTLDQIKKSHLIISDRIRSGEWKVVHAPSNLFSSKDKCMKRLDEIAPAVEREILIDKFEKVLNENMKEMEGINIHRWALND